MGISQGVVVHTDYNLWRQDKKDDHDWLEYLQIEFAGPPSSTMQFKENLNTIEYEKEPVV